MTWAALATAVALPRWLYLAARWSESPSLRTLAWALDIVCLVAAALALWRLQREVGDEESRLSALIAIPGFALDACVTVAERWAKAPWLVLFVAVGAWTFGTSRWLAHRCYATGVPYFLFSLCVVTVTASTIVAWMRPDTDFPVALIIDTGIAVQCALLARALNDGSTAR